MDDMVRVMHRISECSYEDTAMPPMPYDDAVDWLRSRSKLAGFSDHDGPLYDLVYVENGRLASWKL